MKTFSSPVLAALASGNVAFAQLVHLAFSTPTVLNSSTWDLTWSSVVYKGAYGLGTISPISDKPGEVQGVTFEMAAADPSIVSLALDGSDVVQGTVATIRTAIVETSTYTVLDAPIEWLGKLDTMQLSEDASSASVRWTKTPWCCCSARPCRSRAWPATPSPPMSVPRWRSDLLQPS